MSDSAHIRQRSTEGDSRKDLSHPPAPEALPVAVYDNHTHLEIADGDEPIDFRAQLERAAEVGIVGVVQVGTDLATSRWSAEIAASERRVLAAVALHPNDAPEVAARGELDEQLAAIDELASWPRTRAVGETGLDFFRTGEDGRAAQFASFEAHIEIAKKHGIALQIHDRDAHDDVIATLKRVGAPEKTVFHCFSGDLEMAKIAAENGWYLSFSGTFTFKKNDHLREALAFMPRDRVLVETDAPYLTPMPYRGRPNASYMTPYTVRAMAEYLAVDLGDLCADIAFNTEAVYGSWEDGLVTDSAEF
ncbi:MAG: putative deoxyribonuclease YcfH [Actinomycetota bacterium]